MTSHRQDLDLRTAKAILKNTLGHQWTIDGCEGKWYSTNDPDDNSTGKTYPRLTALLAELGLGTGVLLIPDECAIDWDAALEELDRNQRKAARADTKGGQ